MIFKLLLHTVRTYVLDSLANLLLNSDRDIFIDEVLHYFDLVFLFVYVLVHLIKRSLDLGSLLLEIALFLLFDLKLVYLYRQFLYLL